MPLVAHNDLPTFERLRKRGHNILTLEEARQQTAASFISASST